MSGSVGASASASVSGVALAGCATPRGLHTVPQPFHFHSARRVQYGDGDGDGSSSSSSSSSSEAALREQRHNQHATLQQKRQTQTSVNRGFKAGSLTPQSLSLTQRTAAAAAAAASRAACGDGGSEAAGTAALCRRLEDEFILDPTAADTIAALAVAAAVDRSTTGPALQQVRRSHTQLHRV